MEHKIEERWLAMQVQVGRIGALYQQFMQNECIGANLLYILAKVVIMP